MLKAVVVCQRNLYSYRSLLQDPFAKANPIRVEEDKPENERSFFIHPDLFGEPQEKMIKHSIISHNAGAPNPPR